MNHNTVLITGCSSGIGLCTAETLQQRGYRVFAGVRKPQDMTRLEQLGCTPVLLDLADSQSLHSALNSVLAKTDGVLDALINNAAFAQPGAVEDLTREALRTQFETNVFGTQELTNLVVPVMRRQKHGRIVMISSVLGFIPMAYRGAYCASKYALEALSEVLNMELRGTAQNIFVALIEPGPIDSSFRTTARDAHVQHAKTTSNSPHHQQYQALMRAFDTSHGAKNSFTLPPSAVVRKILHALESPRPRVRYCVNSSTYALALLKRLLPSTWMEWVLWQISKREMKVE